MLATVPDHERPARPLRRGLLGSLRVQLICLVLGSLVLSLGLGGVVACINARRSVSHEMATSLTVARQTVASGVDALKDAADWQRDLARLVFSFQGNRHLRVSLIGSGGLVITPIVDRPDLGAVPGWFVRLVDVPSDRVEIPVVLDVRFEGRVRIETDPRNEILEVWDEFCDSALVLALFVGPLLVGIAFTIGRLLRPLGSLASGMSRIGEGDYTIRVEETLPSEFSPLLENFNRMARQLAESEAENHRLNERMLTVQEMERSDVARDLHDEIGPLLFAIRIDATRIAQEAGQIGRPTILDQARGISEAVARAQRQLRDLLGRLRPLERPVLTLAEAIGDLVDFWRRRHPEIVFDMRIAEDWEGLDEVIEKTVFRVVQEGLSNAVRHGRPRRIAIEVARFEEAGGEVLVCVADDGQGAAASSRPGFGLIGMHERVAAVEGSLETESRSGAGFVVTARLPLQRRRVLKASAG